jgi:hypothetical protein
MKVFLLSNGRDFGLTQDLAANAADLTQDLELDTLFKAMAAGDEFLLGVVKKVLFASLREPATIFYRQSILRDCLDRPSIITEIYRIAVEGVERERKVWGCLLDRHPESTLHRSVEVLQILFELLKRLRQIVDAQGAKFRSEGFQRLFERLAEELNDGYLATIEDYLHQLTFRNGMLMSARLGEGNAGIDYILHNGWRRNRTGSNGSRVGWSNWQGEMAVL